MRWRKELNNFIKWSVLMVLVVLNMCRFKYIVNESLVNTTLTLASILFGFLISSICNLFGRKITVQMDKMDSLRDPGKTQLQDLKGRFIIIINNLMMLVVICITYFLAKGLGLQAVIFVQYVAYAVSMIFVYLLFATLYLTFKEVKILLNLLINEIRI